MSASGLNYIRCLTLLYLLSIVSACGGGGESRDSVSASSAPVQVAVTSSGVALDFSSGDDAQASLGGSWHWSKVQAGDVFLQARDPDGRFLPTSGVRSSSAGNFSISLPVSSDLSAGTYSGRLEVRACRDALCADPYPGSIASVAYSLNIGRVPDWETHQGNTFHQGYVPIRLDPSRFSKAWEWSRVKDDPIGGINPVATADGKVYVTKDVYFGEGVLYALNEVDGSEAWRVSFGQVPALNPPAVSNGRVYAAVTGSSSTALWGFDAATGNYLFKAPFEGQWPHELAPTVYGGQVYTGGGFYGGYTYSFSCADGSRTWAHSAGGVWDMYTPAVDEDYVYHYNGNTLFLIDRSTGTTVATIEDPFGMNTGYDYHGAPMIGGRNNVFTFAGGALSGRASSNVEQWTQRVFSSFNIATKTYEWSTRFPYMTAPAVAAGIIYAGRNNPMSLDAIDERDGTILWSWTPSGNGDTTFHRNIVVTRNILFVSTDKAVYALDLATRTPVWSYPEPGLLAISADRTLYIVTGARESNGKLVAVRLR